MSRAAAWTAGIIIAALVLFGGGIALSHSGVIRQITPPAKTVTATPGVPAPSETASVPISQVSPSVPAPSETASVPISQVSPSPTVSASPLPEGTLLRASGSEDASGDMIGTPGGVSSGESYTTVPFTVHGSASYYVHWSFTETTGNYVYLSLEEDQGDDQDFHAPQESAAASGSGTVQVTDDPGVHNFAVSLDGAGTWTLSVTTAP